MGRNTRADIGKQEQKEAHVSCVDLKKSGKEEESNSCHKRGGDVAGGRRDIW